MTVELVDMESLKMENLPAGLELGVEEGMDLIGRWGMDVARPDGMNSGNLVKAGLSRKVSGEASNSDSTIV